MVASASVGALLGFCAYQLALRIAFGPDPMKKFAETAVSFEGNVPLILAGLLVLSKWVLVIGGGLLLLGVCGRLWGERNSGKM